MAEITVHVHLHDVPEGTQVLPIPFPPDMNIGVPYFVLYFPLEGRPRLFAHPTEDEVERVVQYHVQRSLEVGEALLAMLDAMNPESEDDNADG